MYEAFYALRRRPFGLDHPPGNCWIRQGTEASVRHAADALRNGCEGVLVSGPSGSGRSTICRELARRLADRLQSVFLANCEFATTSGLWQAILFELGLEYAGLSEDEARLSILRSANGLRPEREGVLLVVDNADALSDGLLEELRRLLVQRRDGRSIVQLVMSGTIALEERLALPELSGLNQRIGKHIVLEHLNRVESRQYLFHRIETSGGRLADVFSEDAVDAICAASDGNFHCLNHLADHALLLGFTSEERPVSLETVAAALDDLKTLPLPWLTIPADQDLEASDSERIPRLETPVAEGDPGGLPADLMAGVHTAAADDWWSSSGDVVSIEVGSEAAEAVPAAVPSAPVKGPEVDSAMDTSVTGTLYSQAADAALETLVVDRYAWIDRQLELQRPVLTLPASAPDVPHAPAPLLSECAGDSQDALATRIFEDVASLREEIAAATRPWPGSDPSEAINEIASTCPEWDIIEPEGDIPVADVAAAPPEPVIVPEETIPLLRSPSGAASESVVEAASAPMTDQPFATASPHDRRYAQLFTRLRNRRREAAAQSAVWPFRLWR